MAANSLLERNLLCVMECPVCREFLFPPIRQCANGHSFCTSCYNGFKICPKCSAPKSTARCFTLENIHAQITFPCKFKAGGCEFQDKGIKIKDHEEHCKVTTSFCPLKSIQKCLWRGREQDIISHCSSSHYNFVDKNEMLFYHDNYKILKYTQVTSLFYTYDNFFLSMWEQLEDGNGLWVVYFMGAPKKCEKFSYELTFHDKRGNFKPIVITAPCQILHPAQKRLFSESRCMMVHYNMISRFCDGLGTLTFNVKIIKHD